MAETIVLKAEKRDKCGTGSSQKLRRDGGLPAVIYGHKEEPIAISLNYHDVALELQHHHRLLDVELDGSKQQFLVKDVQYDYIGEKILHIDLTRVDLDERVAVTVSVELKGIPAGASEGGVLDQVLADIELECLVTSIPESLRVNVSDMQVGDTILAKDVELPQGAVLVTDSELLVAALRVVGEVDASALEGDEAEPEVIGASDKEDDEETAE